MKKPPMAESENRPYNLECFIDRSATDNTKVSAPCRSNYTTLVAFLICGEISTFFDISAPKTAVQQTFTTWQGL